MDVQSRRLAPLYPLTSSARFAYFLKRDVSSGRLFLFSLSHARRGCGLLLPLDDYLQRARLQRRRKKAVTNLLSVPTEERVKDFFPHWPPRSACLNRQRLPRRTKRRRILSEKKEQRRGRRATARLQGSRWRASGAMCVLSAEKVAVAAPGAVSPPSVRWSGRLCWWRNRHRRCIVAVVCLLPWLRHPTRWSVLSKSRNDHCRSARIVKSGIPSAPYFSQWKQSLNSSNRCWILESKRSNVIINSSSCPSRTKGVKLNLMQ